MIVSKTPLRMSFVGGGSDLPSYYKNYPGAVISTAIKKYIYICVNRKFDDHIRLSYAKTENVKYVEHIEHPLFREGLKLLQVRGGIEISSMADIPSRGTGLGSSSAFTVGLINALKTYRREKVSKDLLASLACEIELDKCGEPIGKQDQYAVSYGGLNIIHFYPDESVAVDPVNCTSKVLNQLEESILVFFTGRTRSASEILKKQSFEIQNTDQKKLLHRMVELVFEMKKELERGSLENFGEFLDENWKLKAQLTPGITDSDIDRWYSTGIKNGALGGKLLGAGNGGFMIFFAPVERHKEISQALSSLQPVKFQFDTEGSQIILNQFD